MRLASSLVSVMLIPCLGLEILLKPTEIIPQFDDFLFNQNSSFDAVLVGGAALAILGLITRETRDCDVIEPELPDTKLFALCDRGQDLGDCLAMQPSPSELAAAEPWLIEQDANPEWPLHVRTALADLGRRCGHGL